MRRALICGVSGQDGAYLARLLVDKGYEVWGSSRDAQMAAFSNLVALGVRDRVHVESVSLTDFRSVIQAISRIEPQEVYNLAGQSSVGLSFEQPVETLESIGLATLNLLEAIRFLKAPIRFYNACSGECFGDTGENPANESTPFRPRSPYAVAKATAHWEVVNYREAYGLHACSGILFNHESPLRPRRFVTRKIVNAAARIARGSTEKLKLGDTSIARDWGWAPEYVDAMWRMLQQERPDDYVIANGETHTLEAFLDRAFSIAGLQWRDHVIQDPSLARPSELRMGRADPSKAASALAWRARIRMHEVVRLMMEAELKPPAAGARQAE